MNRINDTLHRLVKQGSTPSVQYLLFDQHQILHRYGAGFADVANKKKADEHTTYHAFSTTKTFTALAILQLVEKGVVELDKSAAEYMDAFPYSGDITLRQLLSHTAGLPNPNPLPWIHLAREHESFDRDVYFRPILKKHPKVKAGPNTRFAYSNLGYLLLGQLIEQVTGMKYEDYIRDHILRPLEVDPSELDFEISDPNLHARGYHKNISLMNWIMGIFIDRKKFRDTPEGKWQAFKPYYLNGASYGGLIGRPLAFMSYIQELLKTDCRLLSNRYRQMLFTENMTADQKSTGMCLAWFTGSLNGRTYFTHAGGGGGYYCELRLYPDAGTGSVLMCNRSGMKDERFLDKLDIYYFTDSHGD